MRYKKSYQQIIDNKKYCSKCNELLDLELFQVARSKSSGFSSQCKQCKRTSTKPIPREGYKYCSKCGKEQLLSEFTKNQKNVYSHCKTCVNSTSRRKAPIVSEGNKWCGGCKQELNKSMFYIDLSKPVGVSSRCKKCCISAVIKREPKRRKTDQDFVILKRLRGRIREALRNNTKSSSTKLLIGCTIDELKLHLQKTAISNGYLDFNINKYNGKIYHIDHIIPCVKFNLKCSYHQKLCFNWSNLQILSAKDNISKSDKLSNVCHFCNR